MMQRRESHTVRLLTRAPARARSSGRGATARASGRILCAVRSPIGVHALALALGVDVHGRHPRGARGGDAAGRRRPHSAALTRRLDVQPRRPASLRAALTTARQGRRALFQLNHSGRVVLWRGRAAVEHILLR